MKTENLPLIGLERFKEHPEHITYMDDNIAVIDSLNEMMETNENAIKLDCFMLVFCVKGSITTHINGKQHTLPKDHCAILPPNTILRRITHSEQYTLKIVAASQSFLSDILSMNKITFDIIHYLYYHPVHPVKPKMSYKMYLYKELMMTLIQEEPHVYSRQTRRFHLSGLFCEMMAELHKSLPTSKERQEINRSRTTFIVRDFMEMVNADNGSHRSVAYYADRLCYSAKYLSSTVKQVTGKSPLQIINEHAIKEIKHKLKHSEMSMKEMADFFNFTNPSFFGKFVKGHIGMSPLQYRYSDELEKEIPVAQNIQRGNPNQFTT